MPSLLSLPSYVDFLWACKQGAAITGSSWSVSWFLMQRWASLDTLRHRTRCKQRLDCTPASGRSWSHAERVSSVSEYQNVCRPLQDGTLGVSAIAKCQMMRGNVNTAAAANQAVISSPFWTRLTGIALITTVSILEFRYTKVEFAAFFHLAAWAANSGLPWWPGISSHLFLLPLLNASLKADLPFTDELQVACKWAMVISGEQS